MRYVIGIDAGGTKTLGLLADETGRVLAEARASGANFQVHGDSGVEDVLGEVVGQLAPPEPVAAVCLGVAGVGRPEEEVAVLEILRRLGLSQGARIENDAVVALAAGAPEGVGIVLVAGTGSIAYGVDADGHTARSGGWGYLLGDEGSAYWLGHAALRQAIRATEGRGPATAIRKRMFHRLGLQGPTDLVSWAYEQELPRQRVAELASVVEEAAMAGDDAAIGLLGEAARHLARASTAVARQLTFVEPYPLLLAGGLFVACPSLYSRVKSSIYLPLAQVSLLDAEPAEGAVRLALEMLS